jgi:uncharacterized protein DUF3617
MHSPSFRVGVFLAIALIAGSCLALAASKPAAVAHGTGDLWEVTSQLSMEGMPVKMPSQKQSVCAPKEWKEPPGAQNPQQECQISDMKTVGSKTTWKMQCSSPTATGEGEINRTSPTAYTGNIKMTSADGTINIKLSGERVADCNYVETDPQAIEAASKKLDADLAKMQAEGCNGMAKALYLELIKSETAGCNDAATRELFCKTVASPEGTQALFERGNTMPGAGLKDCLDFCAGTGKTKETFCAQFHTTSGYDLLVSSGTGPGSSQATAAAFCGLSAQDLDSEKAKLCKTAASGTSELTFVGKYCPDQAKQIAEKECAGRNFTSMGGSPYAGFCQSYATQMLAGAPAQDAAPAEESKSKKTKKFFKSVWPH